MSGNTGNDGSPTATLLFVLALLAIAALVHSGLDPDSAWWPQP